MDMQLQSSQTPANSYQIWDYQVVGNIVPILNDSGNVGSLEDNQHATVAAYLQYGSIPQLPQFGVQWMEFFTGQVNFGIVDGQIKQNLISTGLQSWFPNYDIVNEKLTVRVVNQ